MNIKTIILAWWSGTRLWPISRKFYPKQFIKLEELDSLSLFQKTLKRAILFSRQEDILVVTNADYKFHCLTQSTEVGVHLTESQILVEPQAKNTLNAVAFWMSRLSNDDIWLVLSSDQVIENEDVFEQVVKESSEVAKNAIVTFWIEPFCPHTWYWYIEADKVWKAPFKVKNFKEKPDIEKAEEFIKNWYFWNSWIFMFSKSFFWSELRTYSPEIAKEFESGKPADLIFANVPDISIDYWMLEHSKNIYLSPLAIYWNDLWSFESIDDYLKKAWKKNNNVIEIDSSDNFVLSEVKDKKIALIWMQWYVVVDTKDALLVSKKWETQKLKTVVQMLKDEKSELANYWVTVYRPWGSYTIIDEWVWFKSKRITVLPWKKLSLQMHYHRSEHWVVVRGTATVINGEKELILHENEST